MKLKFFFLITTIFLVFLACQSPKKSADHDEQRNRNYLAGKDSTATYYFECDGQYQFTARYENDSFWLFLPGKTVKLEPTVLASGTKYTDGEIVFWIKGDEACLEIGDDFIKNCRNNRREAIWEDAKLRGVDFRATGNEPGWVLEISRKDRILFLNNYGTERHEFTASTIENDQKSLITTYKIADGKVDFTVIIAYRECLDNMSGEMFSSEVVIVFDGTTFRGCGRALH